VGVGAGGAVVAVVAGRGVYVGGSERVGLADGVGVDRAGGPESRTLSIYPVAYRFNGL